MNPLVVLGPTASGKSEVAMALAAARGWEIVAVDAMQVYRGMDIGTAKPTAADRARVPHHCLDLADPWQEFSVADFVAAARDALAGIDRRGRRAVLVAGTGLYLRAVIDPLQIPGRWPAVRAELERRVAHEGVAALYAELAALDPAGAERIEPRNARRIVRALEVTLGSGRPFSSFGPGLSAYPPVPFVQVGLRWARDALARRIERRVHSMIDVGLLDEVRGLAAQELSRTARQALGYKELLAHLEGRCSLSEAVDEITLRTCQFAVRQERWFRRDPRVRWVEVTSDPVAEVVAALPAIDRPTP